MKNTNKKMKKYPIDCGKPMIDPIISHNELVNGNVQCVGGEHNLQVFVFGSSIVQICTRCEYIRKLNDKIYGLSDKISEQVENETNAIKKKKYSMAFTYEPKIRSVFKGSCIQTIRKGRKYKVGDIVLLHSWDGKPYYPGSKWINRMKVEIIEVIPIVVSKEGMVITQIPDDIFALWNSNVVDFIAKEDHIDPPTGIALRNFLFDYLNLKKYISVPCQIIRWKLL